MSTVLSVAPMVNVTDRHCRFFLRLFSPSAVLHTGMISASSILHGNRQELLQFSPAEHPVILQLGGSEPRELAVAAQFAEDAGYDGINLNVCCPDSCGLQAPAGARLMLEPWRVAESVAAIRERVSVPVSIKTRIGVEDGEGVAARATQYTDSDYERLHLLVASTAEAGCNTFIIHARKAMLAKFSPKDKCEIPPLRHDIVRRVKNEFPYLDIIANGNIRETEGALKVLERLDGVMIGREACRNPYFLSELEIALRLKSNTNMQTAWQPPSHLEILERLARYSEEQMSLGQRLHSITRHIAGVFTGQFDQQQ